MIREVDSRNYFIPATVMGEPGSVFPGVYDYITDVIRAVNSGSKVVAEENRGCYKAHDSF